MAITADFTRKVAEVELKQKLKGYEKRGERLWLASALVLMATLGLALAYSGIIPGVQENLLGLEVTLGVGLPLGIVFFGWGARELFYSFAENLDRKKCRELNKRLYK